eukprot:COSAG02_NODE_1707_length_11230_cov_3.141946_4_plen_107_part_00
MLTTARVWGVLVRKGAVRMASKSRRKVGSGEAEQADYLRAKIKDTGELVEALRQGIADIALKLQGQMKAMGQPPPVSLSFSLSLSLSCSLALPPCDPVFFPRGPLT